MNVKIKGELQNALEKFGFQTRTAALGASARILARVRFRRIKSIFVYLTKAYDAVIRKVKLNIVQRDHSS